MKKIVGQVFKWLSILCLVVMLATANMPWVVFDNSTLDLSLLGMSEEGSEGMGETVELMQEVMDAMGHNFDVAAYVDSFMHMLDPLTDGDISIVDFAKVGASCMNISEQSAKAPTVEELGEDNPMVSIFTMGLTIGQFGPLFFIPVGIFGFTALLVVVRILFRIFNDKALGLGIVILSIIDAAIPFGLMYFLSGDKNIAIAMPGQPVTSGIMVTYVPVMLVVCSILAAIFWAIARNFVKVKAKKKAKTNEAPAVETPVVEASVVEKDETKEESGVVEETVVTEEIPADTSVGSENTEETVVVEDVK